jgi:hypothetical protein
MEQARPHFHSQTQTALVYELLHQTVGNNAVSNELSKESQCLDPSIRGNMEAKFVNNFRNVSVHIGPRSSEVARHFQAQAFTVGRNIFLRKPSDLHNRFLLAHELTHVLQQKKANSSARVLHKNDRPNLEMEAQLNPESLHTPERISEAPLSIQRMPISSESTRDEKMNKLMAALIGGQSNVDTLAAELTDDEMSSLALGTRVELIAQISEGFIVGDEDEQTIIRLIATTPSAVSTGLLARLREHNSSLLKSLESSIDLDEYKQYHAILRTKFLDSLDSTAPEQMFEQAAHAKVYPWANPGPIESLWKTRFHYDEPEFTKTGKIRVSYWILTGPFGLQTHAEELDPFELIKVHFYADESEANAVEGQTTFMPAINLLALYNKQFKQEIGTAIDVSLLFAGGVGIFTARTKIGKAISALDALLGASDLAVMEFRSRISKIPGGPDFLGIWDTVSLMISVYGIGRVIAEVPGALVKLKNSFQALKRNAGSQLDGASGAKLEDAMLEIDQELQKAQSKSAIGNEIPLEGKSSQSAIDSGRDPQQVFPAEESLSGNLSAHSVAKFEKHKEILKVTESANPVVESLKKNGSLPPEYITKGEAAVRGWKPGKALGNHVPGGQIGGDIFRNDKGLLPMSSGRVWREADIGLVNSMSRKKQPGYRLLYSNDGLLYITTEHYTSFDHIGQWK